MIGALENGRFRHECRLVACSARTFCGIKGAFRDLNLRLTGIFEWLLIRIHICKAIQGASQAGASGVKLEKQLI